MKFTHALVDIGNVLLTFNFEPPMRRLIPPGVEDADQRLMSLLEKKDELETGLIHEDDFVRWASERLGFDGSAEEFCSAWNSIFTPNFPMWETMKELKRQGLTLILFSNINAIHAPSLAPSFEVFELFDHEVFSYRVGAMKPHAAIYEHALSTYGMEPKRTLYIDDLPENIEAGEEHGFVSHQYDHTDHAGFLEWLARA